MYSAINLHIKYKTTMDEFLKRVLVYYLYVNVTDLLIKEMLFM